MPVCVSVKEMRDTSAFIDLVERSAGPVTVTRNGYDQFVAIRSADYDELCQQAARNHVLERMLVAERERALGLSLDARDAIAGLRERHGL